jgi:acyl carrier protein
MVTEPGLAGATGHWGPPNDPCRGRTFATFRHDKAAMARVARRRLLEKNARVKAMSEIAERVKKIVVEHLGVEPEKVTEAASFIDDLGADSLDTVELVMAFEEEFGCEIPDDAAETILTVGDAVKFLEKNAKS